MSNLMPAAHSSPPMGTRFQLGHAITAEQAAHLETHGFLIFDRVASREEIQRIADEVDRLQAQWLAEGRESVFGIPLFAGKGADGSPFLNRLAFTSVFSKVIADFVRDPRFEPIRVLVGDGARIGDAEKDGVVINRYLNVEGSAYPRLGWHTDGLRDLFYGRMPVRMLNIGLHLDDCPADNGGLRLIAGSHRQGFWDMCFRKPYFVSHAADPDEVVIETRAGDLTVHDGRLWHRVAQSSRVGPTSLRRSMYVPYLTGPYEPKNETSPMPLYHRLGMLLRRG